MRPTQKVAVGLLLLGFSAGVSPSHAVPVHLRARPAAPAARGFLDPLRNLLVAVLGRTGYQIDPYGRSLPEEPAGPATPPAGATLDTRGDTSCEIDPYGGCPVGH